MANIIRRITSFLYGHSADSDSQSAEAYDSTIGTEVNETDEYILNAIRQWVWSGFYNPGEVDFMIDDILEQNAHEKMLRSAVTPE